MLALTRIITQRHTTNGNPVIRTCPCFMSIAGQLFLQTLAPCAGQDQGLQRPLPALRRVRTACLSSAWDSGCCRWCLQHLRQSSAAAAARVPAAILPHALCAGQNAERWSDHARPVVMSAGCNQRQSVIDSRMHAAQAAGWCLPSCWVGAWSCAAMMALSNRRRYRF